MPKCIVSGCSNHTCNKDKNLSYGITLHSFPNDLLRIKSWLTQIGQDFGDLEGFAQKVLEGKKMDIFRICSEHFSPESYRQTKKLLKDNALPCHFHKSPQSTEGRSDGWKGTFNTQLGKVDPGASTCVVMKDVQGFPQDQRFSAGLPPGLRMTSMDNNSVYMTERILTLTLEILLLLTGEDYTVVKKTYVDPITPGSSPSALGGRRVDKETDPIPNQNFVSPEKKKEILQLTNQIVQLLTGEMPARCHDVAVYFSLEEWDYIDSRKNLYKSISADDQLLSSQGEHPGWAPKREMENDLIEEPLNGLNTTIIKCLPGGGPGSQFLSDETVCADSMGRDDHISTAQEPLSCSESGEQPVLIPKNEMEDDIIKVPINGLNNTTIKFPTCSDMVSSDYSKQEAISADCTDHNDGAVQEPLSCLKCGKYFRFRSRLIAHERIHTGEKPFSCPECGKYFVRKSQLVQHTKIHTGEQQCSFCGKCFTQKSKLIQHERTHTGERPFSCPQCGQRFAQEATLMKHALIHTGEKPFSCSECGKRFMLKSYLRCHQRTHTGEKPFSCSYCDKGFTQKSHLSQHLKIHTGAKLSCSECGKSFTQKSGLVLHQRLHTGEKPFSCSECGKRFIKKSQLVQHKRIHTGEEQCLVCGKCFTHKSKLIDHQRSHTGERPFTCQCGKSFALKTTLTRHQRLHTGKKLLHCTECGKYFMQKSDLCRHQRTHSGQQPP